jgi:Na+-transporting NADH:ubiquinone oxidoreductase subunit NqrB
VRIVGLDDFLARRTPGRLLLYYLGVLLAATMALSWLGKIPQTPSALAFTTALLLALCLSSNWVFAKAYGAKSNIDSVFITALILALIIPPVAPTGSDGLALPIFAALWAMASKYVLAIDRRHIFNPAAFGVALALPVTSHAANWWIGSYWVSPLVLVGGILMTRKIRCFDVVLPFAAAALGITAFTAFAGYAWIFVWETLTRSAFLFFAFVMLTEPRTLPFGRPWRIAFGTIVGILYAPALHFGAVRLAPETALLAGNLFALAAKWKRRALSEHRRRSA